MSVNCAGYVVRHGATRSNHWFYESWNTNDAIWAAADNEPIPMMFVSFPSLKNPSHNPGLSNKHTGQMMVWTDWSSVAEFAAGGDEAHAGAWTAFRQRIEAQMMMYFGEKFPALAPLVVYRELGTPLATASFTGHEKGGFYGVETTPRRMLSDTLNARGLSLIELKSRIPAPVPPVCEIGSCGKLRVLLRVDSGSSDQAFQMIWIGAPCII